MEPECKNISFHIPLQDEYIAGILSVFRVFSLQERLEKKTALRFQLTAEEFLTYFQKLFPGEMIQVQLYQRGRYCSILFTIWQKNIDLGGLNFINLYGNPFRADQLEDVGLLLINKSVDRMNVFLPHPEVCSIEASFERFPVVEGFDGCSQTIVPPLKVAQENTNLLFLSLRLAGSLYPALQNQSSFKRPEGFLADCKSNVLKYLCIVDQRQVPAAFIYWQNDHGTIQFWGPYLFDKEKSETTAQYAIEQFLSNVGKSECHCVFSKEDMLPSCRQYFEEQNGIFYRNMKEDKGGTVWAADAIIPILQEQFADWNYSRDILKAPFMPTQEKSLLRTIQEQNNPWVELIPLIIGKDFERLLKAHVETLGEKQGNQILMPFCINDVLQAAAMGLALQCGLSFYYFLPGEGVADRVVMRYVPGV